MELIEKLIGVFSPKTAAERAYWNLQASRLYDAAKQHPQHRRPGAQGSGDKSMDHARDNIRDWSRWLDENHDLAIGVLDDLVNKIVGAGINVMPIVADPRTGEMLRDVNREISTLWREWAKRPDVTHEYNFTMVERLVARTLFRDGEVLGQHVLGNKGRIVHGTRIPYSVELIEADFLPFSKNDDRRNIVHGVEKTGWGRPRAYHVYKKLPDNLRSNIRPTPEDTKRVPAELMFHAKFIRRIGQTRGVSCFHGVAHRLDDIKDYEESERLAARIGATMAAYIRKGTDFNPASAFDASGNLKTHRTQEMVGGMIYDDLLPGEDVGTIDVNRPNTALTEFRNSQLRAIAAGTGTQYSSISRNYDGTYSAQRQELVESEAPYAAHRNYLVSVAYQAMYEKFITAAVLSNQLEIPPQIDSIEQMFATGWIAPPRPWIDPKKEIEADKTAVDSNFVPWSQIVLQRTGRDPMVVLEQIKREKEMLAELMPAPLDPENDGDSVDNDDENGEDSENSDSEAA